MNSMSPHSQEHTSNKEDPNSALAIYLIPLNVMNIPFHFGKKSILIFIQNKSQFQISDVKILKINSVKLGFNQKNIAQNILLLTCSIRSQWSTVISDLDGPTEVGLEEGTMIFCVVTLPGGRLIGQALSVSWYKQTTLTNKHNTVDAFISILRLLQ